MTKEAQASQPREASIKSTIDKYARSKDVPLETKEQIQAKAGPTVDNIPNSQRRSPSSNRKSPGKIGLSSMACCTESSRPPSLLNIESPSSNVMSLTSMDENSNSMTAASSASASAPIAPTHLPSATSSNPVHTSESTPAPTQQHQQQHQHQQGSPQMNSGRKRSRSCYPETNKNYNPTGAKRLRADDDDDDDATRNRNKDTSNDDVEGSACDNINVCELQQQIGDTSKSTYTTTATQGQVEQSQLSRLHHPHSQQQHQHQLSTEQIHTLIDNINIPSQVQKQISQAVHQHQPKPSIQNSASTQNKNSVCQNKSQGSSGDTITSNVEGTLRKPVAVLPTSTTDTPQIVQKGAKGKTNAVEVSTSTSKAASSSSSSSSSSTNPQRTSKPPSSTSGRWSRAEHEAFLEGLKIHGREWKKVAQRIPTRTSAQIRSHAQKYFAKLARDEEQQANLWLTVDGNSLDASMMCRGGVGVSGNGESMLSHDGSSGARVGMESDRLLTPSVLERAKKILRDPRGAQLEVEVTLARLRNRYNELQKKLQQKQNAKLAAAVARDANIGNSSLRKQMKELPNTLRYEQQEKQQQKHIQSYHSDRKPSGECQDSLNKMSMITFAQQQNHAIVEPSRMSTTFCKDSLASKELIALHVLGGELYRSGSKENLAENEMKSSGACYETNTPSSGEKESTDNDKNANPTDEKNLDATEDN